MKLKGLKRHNCEFVVRLMLLLAVMPSKPASPNATASPGWKAVVRQKPCPKRGEGRTFFTEPDLKVNRMTRFPQTSGPVEVNQ